MTTRAATVLAASTKKRVVITPQEAITLLCRLCYGKAPGVQVDSIDLFLKLLRRRTTKETRKKKNQQKTTQVAKITVVLQKDTTDLTKLRPLNIPFAIRRIAASMITRKYRSEFAKLLIPTNYTNGVSGGIILITTQFNLM